MDSDSSEYSSDATSGVIVADLQAAANDDLVKAIVLRVNSPGGTVTGSAQIHGGNRRNRETSYCQHGWNGRFWRLLY